MSKPLNLVYNPKKPSNSKSTINRLDKEDEDDVTDKLKSLRKYYKYAKHGCSCLSFYDFIRIYPDLNPLDFNIPVPISWIENNYLYKHADTNKKYPLIAIGITYDSFLLYKHVQKVITENFIVELSHNPYLPMYYVWEHLNLEWKWLAIARYNFTIQEKDLKKFVIMFNLSLKTINTTDKDIANKLCHNKSVPLEWLFKYVHISNICWYRLCFRYTKSEIRLIMKYGIKYLLSLFPNYELVPQEIETFINDGHYTKHCSPCKTSFDTENNLFPLNWLIISGHNSWITPDFVLDNPTYPWIYGIIKMPTVEYAKLYPYNRNIANSFMITLTDLLELKYDISRIPLIETFNDNFTYEYLDKYGLLDKYDANKLKMYRMQTPAEYIRYSNMYREIIKAIKY